MFHEMKILIVNLTLKSSGFFKSNFKKITLMDIFSENCSKHVVKREVRCATGGNATLSRTFSKCVAWQQQNDKQEVSTYQIVPFNQYWCDLQSLPHMQSRKDTSVQYTVSFEGCSLLIGTQLQNVQPPNINTDESSNETHGSYFSVRFYLGVL